MTYGELTILLPSWSRRTLDAATAANMVAKANARVRGEVYGIDQELFTGVGTDEIPIDFGAMLEASVVEVRRWEDDPESADIHAVNYERALAAWQKWWDQQNLAPDPVTGEPPRAPQMRKG